MAKSAGSYILGVKSMNASCSTNTRNVVQYRLMAKNMMADGGVEAAAPQMSSTPIQGGVIKIYANLDTSFFVK